MIIPVTGAQIKSDQGHLRVSFPKGKEVRNSEKSGKKKSTDAYDKGS